jgi:transcription factor SFP1
MLTDTELREVEREVERHLRPFACGVGDCPRWYMNINGLWYHYQHSGDHGSHELALLASGAHKCLSLTNTGGAGIESMQSLRHAS